MGVLRLLAGGWYADLVQFADGPRAVVLRRDRERR